MVAILKLDTILIRHLGEEEELVLRVLDLSLKPAAFEASLHAKTAEEALSFCADLL